MRNRIEEVAYKMFEYEHTNLGWDIEWCESAWENIHDIQNMYIKFAKIALPVQMSYDIMDAKMESLRPEKQGPFWEGVEWAEEQYGIFGDR